MNVLLWSSKNLSKIEKALKGKGYLISYVTAGELLKRLGYSLQGNRKTDEGGNDVDRNEQFEFSQKKFSKSCFNIIRQHRPPGGPIMFHIFSPNIQLIIDALVVQNSRKISSSLRIFMLPTS